MHKADVVNIGDARFMVFVRVIVLSVIKVLIVLVLVNRGVAPSAVWVVVGVSI